VDSISDNNNISNSNTAEEIVCGAIIAIKSLQELPRLSDLSSVCNIASDVASISIFM